MKATADKLARRKKLLEECPHRARRFLINSIVKAYFELLGKNYCFRCGELVEDNFHIDHKIAWEEDPQKAKDRYYDLDNLWMSHPECNSVAKRIIYKYSCQIQRVVERIKRHNASNKKWREKRKLDKVKPK